MAKLLTIISFWLIYLSTVYSGPKIDSPYVFTDKEARIELPGVKEAVPCHISTITVDGFGPGKTILVEVIDEHVAFKPLCEGIHIVSFGAPVNAEVRFLAITPPLPLDPATIRRQLPKTGEKLLSGKPFTILSMGDSVTHTGDYESMLVMMLKRATGNNSISFVDKSYSGRSIDATVRHFERDTKDIRPNLGLLMYGLNDQICFVPLPAYLEQYEWVVKTLAQRFHADTILLQPTPHIDIFSTDKSGSVEPPEFSFRTIGYAEGVNQLGEKLGVPVAQTFNAVWGKGGKGLTESAIAMWPVYPQGYAGQFGSMLESSGRGDTIHPNALGHLQIAKAVFTAIGGTLIKPALTFSGKSRWGKDSVISTITAVNSTDKKRKGRLEAFAPTKAQILTLPVIPYDLKPGESVSFDISWSTAAKPEDLLVFPNDVYLSLWNIPVSVVDFCGNRSSVQSVNCPFEIKGDFVPERLIVDGNEVKVKLETDAGLEIATVKIPEKSQVGRIPLIRTVKNGDRTGYAVAELVYTAFGSALQSEAEVDGNLQEWQKQLWIPVGEKSQARGWNGPEDYRKSTGEAYLEFAFKAGNKGIYLAMRGKGKLTGDNACIFFDPRSPEQLGTAGPYYWLDMSFKKNGDVILRKGETTTKAAGMTGRWIKTDQGMDAECFIPYELMDRENWPESGDLGLSIIWRHKHENGKQTKLLWSEDSHEWNPRWYGVIRLLKNPEDKLPYRVRIK